MGNVRRVYAEKKPQYAVAAKSLYSEIKSYLGITTVTGVRVLIRYDIENISEDTYKKALKTVFSMIITKKNLLMKAGRSAWNFCRDSSIRERIPQSSASSC